VSHGPIYVGVMHVLVMIPGARTRKDKRQVIRGLTDKVKNRFEVTCNQVGEGEHPGRQRLVLTTGGGDIGQVKMVLEKIRSFLHQYERAWPGAIDVETFLWHPGDRPLEL